MPYIYQSDVWCDNCGEKIRHELDDTTIVNLYRLKGRPDDNDVDGIIPDLSVVTRAALDHSIGTVGITRGALATYLFDADGNCVAEYAGDPLGLSNSKVPFDLEDEASYDSGDYPKVYDADNEESDSPENCADGKCSGEGHGTFLENALTSAGYSYLKSMLDEHGETLPPHAKEWADFYQFTYFKQPYEHAAVWLNEKLTSIAHREVFTDRHFAAMVAKAIAPHLKRGVSPSKVIEDIRCVLTADFTADDLRVTELYDMASAMAEKLDGDQIQDLFQSDMEDDDFFKESGWYSPEME